MTGLRVLVTPKDDNPYLELLYGELARKGVQVAFLEGPTSSQTVNLLLSPLALAWFRIRGYRVLHIHWLFKFMLPWAKGADVARRAMQRWLGVYLWVAHFLGFRIVWTAHDLVPHERIFFDDDLARKLLIESCDLIVALSAMTAAQLAGLGARNVEVVPFGSYAERHATTVDRAGARHLLGLEEGDLVFTWIGKVGHYKGVDLLLEAIARVPKELPVRALVAGWCPDAAYLDDLAELGRRAGTRAVVRFERLNDDEIGTYLVAADLAVFPFREVTNSSSVLTALSFGLPVIVPDLDALRDLPDNCVIRYDPAREDLAHVLQRAAAGGTQERRAMGQAALKHTATMDWPSVAGTMFDAYRQLAAQPSRAHTREHTPEV
jgi:glycosyltransferase involved in cell wall biosynthesis